MVRKINRKALLEVVEETLNSLTEDVYAVNELYPDLVREYCMRANHHLVQRGDVGAGIARIKPFFTDTTLRPLGWMKTHGRASRKAGQQIVRLTH